MKNDSYSDAWKDTCQSILTIPAHTDKRAREILEQNFTPDLVRYDNKQTGLFTGYYEPAIMGSLIRSKQFPIPIYKRPKDLVIKKGKNRNQYGRMVDGKLIPYYTHKQIANNNYFSKKNVIAWIGSRIARTFLQIQGSGRIQLENGETLLVGYDGQNGQPYRPIGRYLLEHKLMPRKDITTQSIKKWLNDHPQQADKVLNYDPSFVFFRI